MTTGKNRRTASDAPPRPAAVDPAGHLHRVDLPPRSRKLRRTPTAALCAELVGRARDGAFDHEATIHLGFALQDALESVLDVHLNRFSTRHYRETFGEIYHGLGPVHFNLKGATVVDMGCGSLNPYGLLFVCLMAGAQRGIAVDPDGIEDPPLAVRALASAAATALVNPRSLYGDLILHPSRILDNIASFDLAQLAVGLEGGIDPTRLQYKQETLASVSLAEEADLVLSNSLLEHVDDVDEAIAGLARITRPGGLGVHRIDASDHRRYGNPQRGAHDFLKVKAGDALVFGSNRLRPFEFVALFERHGFEVLEFAPFERVELDEELRGRLVTPFRSMPDDVLTVVGARLAVRRTVAQPGTPWTDPSGSARRSVEAGRELVDRGAYTEAVQEIEEPPETHPDFYTAMVIRGLAYRHLGDGQNARSAFDRAIRATADRPDALIQRAWLHLEHDRNVEAWEDTVAAQRLIQRGDPHETDLHGLLGLLLARRGQHDEALEHVDRLLLLCPDDADVRVNRAWVFQMAGRPAEAASEVEAALAIDPSHGGALELRHILKTGRSREP